jgi:hypothetical protein
MCYTFPSQLRYMPHLAFLPQVCAKPFLLFQECSAPFLLIQLIATPLLITSGMCYTFLSYLRYVPQLSFFPQVSATSFLLTSVCATLFLLTSGVFHTFPSYSGLCHTFFSYLRYVTHLSISSQVRTTPCTTPFVLPQLYSASFCLTSDMCSTVPPHSGFYYIFFFNRFKAVPHLSLSLPNISLHLGMCHTCALTSGMCPTFHSNPSI